jgi:hypothetical protein
MGRNIALSGRIGTLEGKIDGLKSEISALKAVRTALLQALEEVAPEHSLAKRENRNEIFTKAWRSAW